MIYGYALVSTDAQDLTRQRMALKAAGCSRIFREKVSGAKVDRRELGNLLKAITAGAQVVVTRIDRSARSVFELSPSSKRSSTRVDNFSTLPNRGRIHRPARGG